MKQFFVTGTDTDVGKTVVSCGLIQGLVASGYNVIGHKPISAGCELVTDHEGTGLRNEDAQAMMAVSNVKVPYALINPIAFAEPIAPHIAADLSAQSIDEGVLDQTLTRLTDFASDVLLVEGAGGWALPICDNALLSSWVAKHQMPVVIVVAMRLGCLNHALLTYQSVLASGCRVAGWVANDFCDQPFAKENIDTLIRYIDAPLLGVVKRGVAPKDVAAQLDTAKLLTQLSPN